ncbi:MAG: NfeD family protein [Dehalococcoidales bacterium]|jgi:membrane-bound ClpP family serine protease|nr:NfeD family protein [Dehalococcoidales bacterium]MDD5604740.1 NfeD family protein [Dehalococcoidales bacterium]MDX9986383.1 NfeD family protein [Dehalococcoidales bacterium]NLE89827.1 hypothetical protein [Dehalococcoidales bacterium]
MKPNTRLIIAIITNIIEIVAIVVIVRVALPYWEINIPVYGLLLIIIVWLLFSVVIYRIGSHALDRKVMTGLPFMEGTRGVVVKDLSPEGTVKIQGEYWSAYSEVALSKGQEVEVVSEKGMVLVVRPVEKRFNR